MKHMLISGIVALCCAMLAPAASAQNSSDNKNHGNFGIYLDYTRLTLAKANMFGLGGRVGFIGWTCGLQCYPSCCGGR